MKTKFNPKEGVSIHNPWPRSKYPIRHGSAVYFIDGRFGVIRSGRVHWYHPAREADRSCVTSVGHPWFKVRVRGGGDFFAYQETMRPKTPAGLRSLEAVQVRELERYSMEAHNRAHDALLCWQSSRAGWCRKWRRKVFPQT